MQFIKNVSQTFVTSVFTFFLHIPVGIIIARMLGPEGKGFYTLVVLILSYLLLFGCVGVTAAIPFFIGKKRGELKDVISTSLTFSFLWGIIIAFCFMLFSPFINTLFDNDFNTPIIVIVIIAIPFVLLDNFVVSTLLGLRTYTYYNTVLIIKSALTLFLISLLVIFIKMGVYGAVVSYVAAIIVTSLIGVVLIKSYVPFKISFNPSLLKKMISFGWKPYMGSITITLNYNLDLLFVGILLTTSDVGIYSVAVTFSTLTWMMANAVQYIIFPEISHSSSKSKNKNLAILAAKHTFYLTILANIILYIIAWFAIPFLYTKAFSPSLIPLFILITGSTLYSIVVPITATLLGEGKTEIGLLVTAPAVVVNLFFDILLIPVYGIKGAAIASTLGYITSFIIAVIEIHKIYNISFFDLLLIHKNDLDIYKSFGKILIRKIRDFLPFANP